jgi:3-hydroxyacyl-CoA dehydrogenase
MLGHVRLERIGRTLVAIVDNPPVNAISHAVRAGLVKALEEAGSDSQIDAIVIRGDGSGFLAGADIREFGKPIVPPTLGTVVARIEESRKPVIAAIHGAALGGGLEVALAAHYRIAATDAKLGLPEVKLGIIPGSGGTQRLPRLVGLDTALEMIVEGKTVVAGRAHELGMVDAVTADDLTEAAVAFAENQASQPPPKVSDRSVRPNPQTIDKWRARVASRRRGELAPAKAVEAVAWSVDMPFNEALKREYECCVDLLNGAQSKALRHLFVAERVVARPPRLAAGTQERIVTKVAVIGPGTMGTGIAAAFAGAGYPVVLLGPREPSLARSKTAIGKIFASNVARGRMTQEQAEQSLARLTTTLEYGALADPDLIVEAVTEDLAVKKDVFARLGRAAKPGAILASNTSFLPLDEIAAATGRPTDVIGMHFFNPAHIMRLLETVGTEFSSDAALATAMAVGKKIGKMPVLIGACSGFVGNRMLAQRSREGLFLLEEGATPARIDHVFREFGFPMGPYELADLAGLDVMLATRKARFSDLTPREQACDIIPRLVAAGRLGQKSGAGFYAYHDRKPQPDPLVDELIAAHASAVGVTRREIADEEILERCLFAMINEGARLLDEGVVERPHEIDIVWTQGLGFPAYRGGPMFYADEIGLDVIRRRLAYYAATCGVATLTPTKLVDRLSQENRGFYQAFPVSGTGAQ